MNEYIDIADGRDTKKEVLFGKKKFKSFLQTHIFLYHIWLHLSTIPCRGISSPNRQWHISEMKSGLTVSQNCHEYHSDTGLQSSSQWEKYKDYFLLYIMLRSDCPQVHSADCRCPPRESCIFMLLNESSWDKVTLNLLLTKRYIQ